MLPKKSKKTVAAIACALVITVSATSSVARVIGDDDRRSVSHEENERYGAIGVVAVDDGRFVYGGTGTLVNDRLTVLTAFHNVFHDGTTGPIGQVKAPLRRVHFIVVDPVDGGLTYYAVKSVHPFRRKYGFVLPDQDDLAVLTLVEPVSGAQPLSLQSMGPDDDGRGLGDVTLVGYAGLNKLVQECRFRERRATYPRSVDVLVHDCDSEGNTSGSPFLDRNGRIVAIHLGGSPRGLKTPGMPYNPFSNFNVARRFTPEVLDFVDRTDQVHAETATELGVAARRAR